MKKHFKSAVAMIEYSIAHGLLKNKFEQHGEFIEKYDGDSSKYVRLRDVVNSLRGENADFSQHYVEKLLLKGVIKTEQKRKFSARWILKKDILALRKAIRELEDPVLTEEGKFKFVKLGIRNAKD